MNLSFFTALIFWQVGPLPAASSVTKPTSDGCNRRASSSSSSGGAKFSLFIRKFLFFHRTGFSLKAFAFLSFSQTFVYFHLLLLLPTPILNRHTSNRSQFFYFAQVVTYEFLFQPSTEPAYIPCLNVSFNLHTFSSFPRLARIFHHLLLLVSMRFPSSHFSHG